MLWRWRYTIKICFTNTPKSDTLRCMALCFVAYLRFFCRRQLLSEQVSFPYHVRVLASFMGTTFFMTFVPSHLWFTLVTFSVVDKMPSFEVREIRKNNVSKSYVGQTLDGRVLGQSSLNTDYLGFKWFVYLSLILSLNEIEMWCT